MFRELMVVAGLFAIQGCSLVGYDHRQEIAMSSLYDEKGHLDEAALSAALNGKTGLVGSPVSSLQAYVGKLGGTCEEESKYRVFCSIPETGTICYATNIALIATVEYGVVRHIQVSPRATGC